MIGSIPRGDDLDEPAPRRIRLATYRLQVVVTRRARLSLNALRDLKIYHASRNVERRRSATPNTATQSNDE